MPIDEIEIPGSSLTINCFSFKSDSITELFERIKAEGELFSVEPENAGFHDFDCNGKMIRGFFSIVVPFEVEHLVDGIVTKTLFKRVESCDFIATENMLWVMGKSEPSKVLERCLTSLTGYGTAKLDFEFRQMSQFQERLSQLKNITVTNPKDREVRKARLAGKIEDYTEYNITDPRNHGIDSVSGLVDSPLGPITVTVSRKGTIRLGVRKGFILTLECLEWLLSLIRDEKAPDKDATDSDYDKHTNKMKQMARKMDSDLKKEGHSMTITVGDRSVTIGKTLTKENVREELSEENLRKKFG